MWPLPVQVIHNISLLCIHTSPWKKVRRFLPHPTLSLVGWLLLLAAAGEYNYKHVNKGKKNHGPKDTQVSNHQKGDVGERVLFADTQHKIPASTTHTKKKKKIQHSIDIIFLKKSNVIIFDSCASIFVLLLKEKLSKKFFFFLK